MQVAETAWFPSEILFPKQAGREKIGVRPYIRTSGVRSFDIDRVGGSHEVPRGWLRCAAAMAIGICETGLTHRILAHS